MLLRSLLALLTLVAPAAAQSFNVEIGSAGTAPSSSFGAVAAQPGVWNSITSATAASSVLTNLDGTPSSVTFTRTTTGSFITNTNASLTGDYNKLLTDTQSDTTNLTYSFSGLAPGFYLVIVYATDTNSATNTFRVDMGGANGQIIQYCGASIPASNTFSTLKTHAINIWYRWNSATPLVIDIYPSVGSSAQCAGIQLVSLGSSGRARFYVNANATGDNSGMSWNNAYKSFQDALVALRLVGPSCEAWVAGGSYKPSSGSDQAAKFELTSHTKFYGGFAGTETDLAQRGDPLAHQTILSGALGDAAIDSDNAQLVVDASGTDDTTVIDGFSIARGYNDSGSSYAGGLRLDDSYATVSNCRFLYNHASSGGAVSVSFGKPKFINCYFYQNSATVRGGAMYLADAPQAIDLVNCSFYGNESFGDGGALYASKTRVDAVNCLFTGNSTNTLNYGGAACIVGNNNSTISSNFMNCTFAANSGYVSGGAIYIADKIAANVSNCILWNDTSTIHPSDSEYALKPGTGCSFVFADTTVKGFAGTNGLNPMFVNQLGNDGTPGNTDDNLRLSPGSPCIDFGKATSLPWDYYDLDSDGNSLAERTSLDLDKKPRRSDILGAADATEAGSPPVDRGCYELQMPDCPADLTHDGLVDLLDYFAFFNAFDQNLAAADVDLSGQIDLSDYFAFFNSFDVGCP